MKGKPIEPGCLALIVGTVHQPKNNGKVVRVVRKLSRAESRVYRPPGVFISINPYGYEDGIWVIETLDGNQSLQYVVDLWQGEKLVAAKEYFVSERDIAECRLKRLDDGEDYKEREVTTQLEDSL